MNIYRHLSTIGEAPENFIGREIVTLYKSKRGKYAIGLLGMFVATEDDNDDYMPLYISRFEYEFLELEPAYLLSLFAFIHRKASERGKKIKGKDA